MTKGGLYADLYNRQFYIPEEQAQKSLVVR